VDWDSSFLPTACLDKEHRVLGLDANGVGGTDDLVLYSVTEYVPRYLLQSDLAKQDEPAYVTNRDHNSVRQNNQKESLLFHSKSHF